MNQVNQSLLQHIDSNVTRHLNVDSQYYMAILNEIHTCVKHRYGNNQKENFVCRTYDLSMRFLYVYNSLPYFTASFILQIIIRLMRVLDRIYQYLLFYNTFQTGYVLDQSVVMGNGCGIYEGKVPKVRAIYILINLDIFSMYFDNQTGL